MTDRKIKAQRSCHLPKVTQQEELESVLELRQRLTSSPVFCASGRVFPSSFLSYMKEIPDLLTLGCILSPEVTLGTNRKMGGGGQGVT